MISLLEKFKSFSFYLFNLSQTQNWRGQKYHIKVLVPFSQMLLKLNDCIKDFKSYENMPIILSNEILQ
jgi:hypothetical protein